MKKIALILGLVAFLTAGTVYALTSLQTSNNVEMTIDGEGDKVKKKKEATSKKTKSDAKKTKMEESKKNKKNCSHTCTGKTKVS